MRRKRVKQKNSMLRVQLIFSMEIDVVHRHSSIHMFLFSEESTHENTNSIIKCGNTENERKNNGKNIKVSQNIEPQQCNAKKVGEHIDERKSVGGKQAIEKTVTKVMYEEKFT